MLSRITSLLDTLAPRETDLQGWTPDPPDAYCPRCGLCVGTGEVVAGRCSRCHALKLPWRSITRLGRYQPPLSAWIKRLKYHHRHAWADRLGERLATALPQGLHPCTVTPVPMHILRRTLRGLDHADLIASAIARHHHWPHKRLLRRTRLTPPQSLIAPSERFTNLKGAIAPRRRAPRSIPSRVLLIDDIKTTGATLTRCARELQKMGVPEIHVAVLAVAEHR